MGINGGEGGNGGWIMGQVQAGAKPHFQHLAVRRPECNTPLTLKWRLS
jgi:hypothetical protein